MWAYIGGRWDDEKVKTVFAQAASKSMRSVLRSELALEEKQFYKVFTPHSMKPMNRLWKPARKR